MRTFWLAARVAGLFALLMVVVLVGVSLVGMSTVGEAFHRARVDAVAADAVVLARELEARLGGRDVDSPEAERIIRELAAERHRTLALFDGDGRLVASTGDRTDHRRPFGPPEDTIELEGRTCRVVGGPSPRAEVPIMQGARQVGSIEMRRFFPQEPDFGGFHRGLVAVGLVALLGIVAIALYLTRPIRKMSQSMDRIARGDLEHRVPVKGRDEVARMARSFNAMTDRLVSMIKGQGELAAGASHELRSPLARMKVSIEMLREGGADPARLDAIEAEVDALDALVAQLLAASRLRVGSSALEPEVLEVRELVDEGWRRATSGRDEESLPELEVDVPADAAQVVADRPYALRVFGNLLENAVRYGGGEPVSVMARREDEEEGPRVRVTVSDRGPGVPDEALDKLFEPFFRVDGSRSRRTGGSGLGLMIVRNAVEAHGGSVEATSEEAGGLAVSFDLPAPPARGGQQQ